MKQSSASKALVILSLTKLRSPTEMNVIAKNTTETTTSCAPLLSVDAPIVLREHQNKNQCQAGSQPRGGVNPGEEVALGRSLSSLSCWEPIPYFHVLAMVPLLPWRAPGVLDRCSMGKNA